MPPALFSLQQRSLWLVHAELNVLAIGSTPRFHVRELVEQLWSASRLTVVLDDDVDLCILCVAIEKQRIAFQASREEQLVTGPSVIAGPQNCSELCRAISLGYVRCGVADTDLSGLHTFDIEICPGEDVVLTALIV